MKKVGSFLNFAVVLKEPHPSGITMVSVPKKDGVTLSVSINQWLILVGRSEIRPNCLL
jgi:hypothetical protein